MLHVINVQLVYSSYVKKLHICSTLFVTGITDVDIELTERWLRYMLCRKPSVMHQSCLDGSWSMVMCFVRLIMACCCHCSLVVVSRSSSRPWLLLVLISSLVLTARRFLVLTVKEILNTYSLFNFKSSNQINWFICMAAKSWIEKQRPKNIVKTSLW